MFFLRWNTEPAKLVYTKGAIRTSVLNLTMPHRRVLAYYFSGTCFILWRISTHIQKDIIFRTSHDSCKAMQVLRVFFFHTRSEYNIFSKWNMLMNLIDKESYTIYTLALYHNPIEYVQWLQFHFCRINVQMFVSLSFILSKKKFVQKNMVYSKLKSLERCVLRESKRERKNKLPYASHIFKIWLHLNYLVGSSNV